MAITATEIGSGINTDGFDAADITGNGLMDLLIPEEGGKVYWLEQTTRGNFTQRTIHGSDVGSSKIEGGTWIDIDGDGYYEVAILDQANATIRIYKPDTPGAYTGTWSGGTVATGKTRIQNAMAWDVDGDGTDELVYAFEGNYSTTGGISWLDYNSGDVTSSGSYTDRIMTSQVGAWWLSRERKDLGGAQGASDFAFTARDTWGSSSSEGVYILKAPADVTSTWTKVQVDGTAEQWLHLDFGNFFGTSDKDIVAHSYIEGTLAIYDYDNAWAKTTIVVDPEKARYNSFTYPYKENGRNKIVSTGRGSVQIQNYVVLWGWNGSAWVEEDSLQNYSNKCDDRGVWMDIDGTGGVELVTGNSEPTAAALYYYTFPALEKKHTGLAGGKFTNL